MLLSLALFAFTAVQDDASTRSEMYVSIGSEEQAPVESDFYTLDYLTPPTGEKLEVGGMAFLSDGTLLVSTRRGRVWWIDNPMAKDPSDAKFHIFAEGLHEGIGLSVKDDRIYLMQRSELSELIDLDGDHICDRVRTISQDFGMSGNYHEFAFGLPIDGDGNFYIGTNVGFWNPEWWHGLSIVPHRGWIMKVAPDGTTTPIASGARGPAGMGFDADGKLFYTDNQGDWIPVCSINQVNGGEFFGHPASLRWTDEYLATERIPESEVEPTVERTRAAIYIPYEWSQSTGNLVPDVSNGQFGPFEGQLFVAELTRGMVLRSMMEEVQGQMQGAILPFFQGVGSTFRVEFAPDGSLFAGMTNRGWGGLSPDDGIARLRWTGEVPLEYKSIHIEQDGFSLGFTKPLTQAPDLGSVSAYDYDYNWWWDYGSPMKRQRTLNVTSAVLSEDGLQLRIQIEGIKAGRCMRVAIEGVGLLHNEFDYTINQLPNGEPTTEFVAKDGAAQEADNIARRLLGVRESDDGDWISLNTPEVDSSWSGFGWNTSDAATLALDENDGGVFIEQPGSDVFLSSGAERSDLRSLEGFGDMAFKFRFMMGAGADSGLYMMDRYELQLNDSARECGGIWSTANPDPRMYRGPGEWHTIEGRFYGPQFDGAGTKIADARFEDIYMDEELVVADAVCGGVTGGAISSEEVLQAPLRFQVNVGVIAIADMRVKRLAPEIEVVSTADAEEESFVLGEVVELWNSGDPLAAGWKMAGPGEFVVDGDALKATGGMGLLWYAGEDFEDFQLELDWQVEARSNNSGVFVRFPDPGVDPWVAVNGGYELQICDADPAKHNTGSVYSFQGSKSIPTKAVGEWNHYLIRVIGQHYHLEVNGVVVNDFTGSRTARGFIGLQNHDDGSPVRFKNIKVTKVGS